MSTKVILETDQLRYTFETMDHLKKALLSSSSIQIMFIASTCFDKVEKKFLKHRYAGSEIANEVLKDSGLI